MRISALIAEQAEQAALLRFGLRLAGHPAKLLQALKLRAGLTGIRYATACWPVSAQGGERLESVTLRRGDGTRGPNPAITWRAASVSCPTWNWRRCSAAA